MVMLFCSIVAIILFLTVCTYVRCVRDSYRKSKLEAKLEAKLLKDQEELKISKEFQRKQEEKVRLAHESMAKMNKAREVARNKKNSRLV